MKIVFWAPVHGQTRQSSNMLAVSLMMAMKQRKRLLLTQTQFCMNDMEDAIVGRVGAKEIREQFYQDMGIDSLMRCIKRKRPDKTDVENCCVQLLPNEELVLLPGSQSSNYEVYSEILSETIVAMLSETEKYYDAVLIDATPGIDKINKKLFEDADLVVVNLSQNIGVIDLFFRSIPEELLGKKVFYLFGSYLSDSSFNIKNLRIRYPELKMKNTGVVPMNVGFMDAISVGRLLNYFEENIECEQWDVNYWFVKAVNQTVELLCQLIDEIEMEKNKCRKQGVDSQWKFG